MSTLESEGLQAPGLTEEFIQSGHRAGDVECGACRPDYPRRCACGGLVHALGHSHTGVWHWETLNLACCCDVCGLAYQEEEMAEEADEDDARD